MPNSKQDFPDASELAAFRAVMTGSSSREAIDLYLSDRRRPGASARAIISAIRKRLVAIARKRHRDDLATLMSLPPCSRRAARVPAAIETLRAARVPTPVVTDDVDRWLSTRLSAPLRASGVTTIAALVVRVVASPLWWKKIEGLGRIGARQVRAFLDDHPDLLERARAVAPVTFSGLVPWEQLKTPRELDGSKGAFRAPRTTCVLSADNDYQAVNAWLELHESEATRRAYRKEAERLMLWAIVERNKALSSLTTEDAIAYRTFLRNPTPKSRWIGQITARSKSDWRPFQAALSPRSAAYALQVIGAAFRWLIEQRYVLANPFAGVKVKAENSSTSGFGKRSFSEHEWGLISMLANGAEIERTWSEEAVARLRFVLSFSYGTGLRSSELVGATLGSIQFEHQVTWLEVQGKGNKRGRVVVPPVARGALDRYLVLRGLPATPARWDPATPLLPHLGVDGEAVSSARLWQITQRFFDFAGAQMASVNPALATKLRRASPHWMRHTHATHALSNGVALVAVRDNLRHSSISTTSTYLHADDDERAFQFSAAFLDHQKPQTH